MKFALALASTLTLLAQTACEDPTRRVLGTENPAPPDSSRAAPRTPRVSLFSPAMFRDGLADLQKKAGSPRQLLKLTAYGDRIVLQAQDPSKPNNVDQYIYRDEKVEGPVPVKLKGPGSLEDNLFAADEPQLAVIPALVVRSIEAARVEGGVVMKVEVKRNLPESTDILFRVHVVGPRRDAVVVADREGSVLEDAR